MTSSASHVGVRGVEENLLPKILTIAAGVLLIVHDHVVTRLLSLTRSVKSLIISYRLLGSNIRRVASIILGLVLLLLSHFLL